MALETKLDNDPRSISEISLERNSGLVVDSLFALGFPVAVHYGINHYELGTSATIFAVTVGAASSVLAAYSAYLNFTRDGKVLDRRKLE